MFLVKLFSAKYTTVVLFSILFHYRNLFHPFWCIILFLYSFSFLVPLDVLEYWVKHFVHLSTFDSKTFVLLCLPYLIFFLFLKLFWFFSSYMLSKFENWPFIHASFFQRNLPYCQFYFDDKSSYISMKPNILSNIFIIDWLNNLVFLIVKFSTFSFIFSF